MGSKFAKEGSPMAFRMTSTPLVRALCTIGLITDRYDTQKRDWNSRLETFHVSGSQVDRVLARMQSIRGDNVSQVIRERVDVDEDLFTWAVNTYARYA